MFRLFLALALFMFLSVVGQAQEVICENGVCRLAPIRSLWEGEPVYVQRTLWEPATVTAQGLWSQSDCGCGQCPTTVAQTLWTTTTAPVQWVRTNRPVSSILSRTRHRLRGLFCR